MSGAVEERQKCLARRDDISPFNRNIVSRASEAKGLLWESSYLQKTCEKK